MCRKKTTEVFVNEVRAIHGDRYDCSEVVYRHAKQKVTLTCVKHGHFEMRPNNFLSGQGCPRCGKENCASKLKMSFDEFLSRANELHNGKYVYDATSFTSYDDHVKYTCLTCDARVTQSAKAHLKGRACPFCVRAARRWTRPEFLKAARAAHDDEYQYDLSKWDSSKGKNNIVKIKCHECNAWFEQLVQVHVTAKSGCPRCARRSVAINVRSKAATAWLDSLEIPIEMRERTVPNTRFIADALTNRTIYEFYGRYYHGDPRHGPPDKLNHLNKKTYLELYDATIARQAKLESLGYEVKFVWELDWLAGVTFSSEHPERWHTIAG